ncbi:unnamed protein product [Callosobruchus maculatus]|uniref:Uncharacterized protein n=1 Tax=Callosobruchus maculatus TaxID=64391 RepID=A0A653DLY0_CALMS|nr:unnamed protein product [Callosobruchus maculatus]
MEEYNYAHKAFRCAMKLHTYSDEKTIRIMTLYWWMHWFWITYLMFMTFGENITVLHSNSTDCLPAYKSGTSNGTTKGATLCLSSTPYPRTQEKSTTPPKKLIFKSVLPSLKKANISSVIKLNTSSYDGNISNQQCFLSLTKQII